jgi:hypothetical protein
VTISNISKKNQARDGDDGTHLILKTELPDYINKTLPSHLASMTTTSMIKGEEVTLQRPEIGVVRRGVDVLNTE